MNEWRKREDQLDWIFQIDNVDSINLGNNVDFVTNESLNRYVTKGALLLCVAYSGDYFEDYVLLTHSKELPHMFFSSPRTIIGSYGLGNAKKIIKLSEEQVRGALMGKVLIVPSLPEIEKIK